MSNGKDPTDSIAALGEIRTILTSLVARVEELAPPEPPKKVARGTRDISPQARAAVTSVAAEVAPVEVDLRGRIEAALRAESMEPARLARAVGESPAKVAEMLRVLRREDHVWNVGGAERPVWTWRIGPAAETKVLRATIERLISERPLTTAELTAATGATMSRVNGVMVEIQRDVTKRIMNLGEGHTYRWLLLTERAKDARLAPKRPRRERR